MKEPVDIIMKNNEAAVFILFGQSNAVGHAIPMEENDKIKIPLKNVFGLCRDKNQSFNITELSWSGYTSSGMNLGETQDDTYSVANCLAQQWQKKIDDGNNENLPDLYIIQIAIGAQGVTEKYMWHPKREAKLCPGVLGKVDISLYPFAVHVLSLLDDSMKKLGKKYEVIGLHWRGGEEDVSVEKAELENVLKKIYEEMFDGFEKAIGRKVPVVLHYDNCMEAEKRLSRSRIDRIDFINSVFDELAKKECFSTFDAKKAPFYDKTAPYYGLWINDWVHYTPRTNKWVASQILSDYIYKRRGVVAKCTDHAKHRNGLIQAFFSSLD